jgi:hypothetical protein
MQPKPSEISLIEPHHGHQQERTTPHVTPKSKSIFEITQTATLPIHPLWKAQLAGLAKAIRQHVGDGSYCCWYPFRDNSRSVLAFHLAGTQSWLDLYIVPDGKTSFPTAAEIQSGSAQCSVTDMVDAFFLSVFLFDALRLVPPFDEQHVIVPQLELNLI